MSARESFLRRWYEIHKAEDPHHCEAWVSEDGSIHYDAYSFETFAASMLANSGCNAMTAMLAGISEFLEQEAAIREELAKYVSMPAGESIVGGIRNLAQVAQFRIEQGAPDNNGHIAAAAAEIFTIVAQSRLSEVETLSQPEIEHIIHKNLAVVK